MNKLTFTDLKEQQIIDIRSQHEYQAGHVEYSINLNPGNFKTYALDFLSTETPLVFATGQEDESEISELKELAEELGFTQVEGYLRIEDVPSDELQTTDTISAADFLAKEDEYILLDIRHPDEITRPAPEKNLVNIPLEELAETFETLDSNKQIYTLCGSGNRSTTAASYLAKKGFNTAVVAGGMKAIQEESK